MSKYGDIELGREVGGCERTLPAPGGSSTRSAPHFVDVSFGSQKLPSENAHFFTRRFSSFQLLVVIVDVK